MLARHLRCNLEGDHDAGAALCRSYTTTVNAPYGNQVNRNLQIHSESWLARARVRLAKARFVKGPHFFYHIHLLCFPTHTVRSRNRRISRYRQIFVTVAMCAPVISHPHLITNKTKSSASVT